VLRSSSSDLRYIEQVVSIKYPLRAAKAYLQRNLGNEVTYRLVETGRGEASGHVRSVEILHANGGARTTVTGERQLANGQPASFYVPDHLVTVMPVVAGASAHTRTLSVGDIIVLHVPVRGYLRFLPAVFQGDGPVSTRELIRTRDTALQKWGGGLPNQQAIELEVDEDPLRRFLFIFQHVMATITDQIDHIVDLTDPLACNTRFLPWLASWVGFELDLSLPIHQQRELVRRAIRLYRTRGTRRGIEEMVRVLTSAPVRVRERKRAMPLVLGKSVLISGRNVVERYHAGESVGAHLMAPERHSDTSFFALMLEPRERFRLRFGERAPGVLKRIVQVVSQERPVHVAFTVQFDKR
jgi:phage tail-like protein